MCRPDGPPGVHPPGSEDFERTAQAWLLDTVPADYRLHGVLRRYPLALAAMAVHHTKACVAGAREGYRTARTELGNALPPHALDAVLAAYRAEGRRLVATAQAVDLVARALRGEVFTPQLQDAQVTPAERTPASAHRTSSAPGARHPAARRARRAAGSRRHGEGTQSTGRPAARAQRRGRPPQDPAQRQARGRRLTATRPGRPARAWHATVGWAAQDLWPTSLAGSSSPVPPGQSLAGRSQAGRSRAWPTPARARSGRRDRPPGPPRHAADGPARRPR